MPLSPGVENCIRDGQERRVNETATILVKVMQSVQRGQFSAEREGAKLDFCEYENKRLTRARTMVKIPFRLESPSDKRIKETEGNKVWCQCPMRMKGFVLRSISA